MIIFIFLLIFLLYFLVLRGGNNPYKLIMIFGKKGSGKTSLIAKLSLKYLRKGYKIYSNVAVAGVNVFSPDDVGTYGFEPNSVVFIDEVGLIWDNRKFKQFNDYVKSLFKYQRQYKLRIYLFSQAFDIDKKLRDLTDYMFILGRIGNISIARKVIKRVGISQDTSGNGNLVDTYKWGSVFDLHFTYLPRYYGLFESYNPPKLDLIHSTYSDFDDISKIYSSTKLWLIWSFNCMKNRVVLWISTAIGKHKR